MNGNGKLYYSDKKLRYEGEFKNGLFHGSGTEYSDNQIEERENEIDEEYIKIFKGSWIKY
jgi:antitoxin component YwqK of YwqJK toxin-antitoxin module